MMANRRMYSKGIIEEIVARELQPLCTTCIHMHTCMYYQQATRAVIQCESYEVDDEDHGSPEARGLCKNCDNLGKCTLPGKNTGTWHCNDYK
jgi:hypothetical protein